MLSFLVDKIKCNSIPSSQVRNVTIIFPFLCKKWVRRTSNRIAIINIRLRTNCCTLSSHKVSNLRTLIFEHKRDENRQLPVSSTFLYYLGKYVCYTLSGNELPFYFPLPHRGNTLLTVGFSPYVLS
jgi:hypothetical protein